MSTAPMITTAQRSRIQSRGAIRRADDTPSTHPQRNRSGIRSRPVLRARQARSPAMPCR
jgi:hypothetical protein